MMDHFQGIKYQAKGVTAALLEQHGFSVLTEDEFLKQLAHE